MATDDDQEGTINSLLTYVIDSQEPVTSTAFSIDAASGEIKTLRSLQRKDEKMYNLYVKVSDKGNTRTHCLMKHTCEKRFLLQAEVLMASLL